MKTGVVLRYAAAGAVAGAVAGLAAAGSASIHSDHLWAGLALAGAAGVIAASAGAVASGAVRAAAVDCTAGFILGCAGYLGALGVHAKFAQSSNAAALSYVALAAGFSFGVAASHASASGMREARVMTGFFGGIAGLIGLAGGVQLLLTGAQTLSTAGAVGAGLIYGLFLWTAVGVSRRALSADVERFRV